jgi:hypothetical protein
LFTNQLGVTSSFTGTSPTISNANLTVTAATSSIGSSVVGTFGVTTGKFYCEYTPTAVDSTGDVFGFIQTFNGGQSYNGYRSTGAIYNQGSATTGFATWTTSDVIGMALDCGAGTLACYKNNTLISTITITGGVTDPMFPIVWFRNDAGAGSVNFGQRPFSYTPPTGFVALNTYNLSASTVPNGASYMAATLYTGNGYPTAGTQTIANTVGSVAFQPDFAWIKIRSAAGSHVLTDSVRGVNSQLFSNLTAAQETNTDHVTAFTSSGFSLGSGTTGTYPSTNNNGATYVAWQWKGGGTAVSNTSGSITSSVSANTTSGCSVVTFTGQTSGVGTVGHGLGVAPSLKIIKARANAYGWPIYHVSLGNTSYVVLNSTNASTIDPNEWNNTSPTSSVFTLGTNFVNYGTGVAYCFAAIKGFSAFGSYTGNGSTDGPFVYLGFRPRYLMLKVSSTAGYDWLVYDSSRDPYNVTQYNLRADTSDAESTQTANYLDFLSNGFKIRGSSAGSINPSQTVIYAAFAESPFQNSLAR